MALIFIDLDHTLIQGDSDYLWGEFLITKGLQSAEEFKKINDAFYKDYENGVLDVEAYLQFSLASLAKYPADDLLSLNHEFFETIIKPIIYPEGLELIKKHKTLGNRVIVSSATNSFIVSPIALHLGVQDVICTKVESIAGQYTGKYLGIANSNEGKVKNIYLWLTKNGLSIASLLDSEAYSDSHNDIPMLSLVDFAVATNPNTQLREHALNHSWKIIDFKPIK